MRVEQINHKQKPNLNFITAGLFLGCLLILTACFPEKEKVIGPNTLTLIQQSGEKIYFEVELAITPDEMAMGLMGRKKLPEDEGMLFFFGQPQIPGFWMKETLIPLDMIFIDPAGRIIYIHENAQPHDLTTIRPPSPVIGVLEINGGLSTKWGILEGDRVYHPIFQEFPAQ